MNKAKRLPKASKEDHFDVLLTGTGSLAKATLLGWPAQAGGAVRRILILGRAEQRARELADFANLRAAAAGCRIDCIGRETDWEIADLRRHLASAQPRLVLHTASLQSPWAQSDANSEWRNSIRQYGYGLTTVLHATLALRVGRAIAAVSPGCSLINCCYPDAVNPLTTRAGVRVLCGAGNVAIVEAVWRWKMPSKKRVRILAHHAHLVQLFRPGSGSYPRVWIGADESRDVKQVLGNVRLPADNTLNAVTGTVTANLVVAVLGRDPVHTHAPAPVGLGGGYPILAGAGKVSLDLPPGIDLAEARQFIESAQVAEGIAAMDENGLRYTEELADQLERSGSRFAKGFSASQLEEAGADMLEVRRKLGGAA